MRRLILCVLAACAGVGAEEPTAPNQLRDDGKADGGDPLWAGLTSVTFERYSQDPCDDGRNALGDAPAVYDEWVRERAGIRNVCFEVWKPGVTDTDDPSYWRELDVEVHYRFGHSGAFQMAYVPSIDQRGHNRRYAWTIDYALDPIPYTPSVATMKVPFQIVGEGNGYATVQADLEVYFTVNGRVLNAPSDHPFLIRYEGYLAEPAPLAAKANGYVLYDIVTCSGARFGSGAGYFAADISDASAIAALHDSSLVYGGQVGMASANVFSAIYSSEQNVTGQALPGFYDSAGVHVTPSGDAMTMTLDVYDRSAGATRQLAYTFGGCAASATH